MRKKPELIVVAHYMVVNGERIPIDDFAQTNIPDRCKLILAEMLTGKKYRLVDCDS